MAVLPTYKRLTVKAINAVNPVESVTYDGSNRPISITYNVQSTETETVEIQWSEEGHPEVKNVAGDFVEFKDHSVNIYEGRLELKSVGGALPTGPTTITITNTELVEGQPIGTNVGILNTIGGAAPYTYQLIGGDTDKFSINGSTLKTADILTAVDSPYDILILSTDSNMESTQRLFSITATPNPITNILLDSITVPENSPIGTVVGTISTVGGTAPFSYLLSGDDASKFQIVGNELRTAEVLTIPQSPLSITITSTDVNTTQFSQPFSIVVTLDIIPSSLSTSFDGLTEHVTIPDNPSLNITDNISVTAWVKTTSSNSQAVVGKWDTLGGDFNRSWLLGLGPSGALRTFITSDGANTRKIYDTTATINDGDWHHVGFTYTSVGQILKVYIDGVPANVNQTQDDPVPSIAVTTAPVQIGTFNSGQTWNLDGFIDEVGIYYNQILTDADMLSIYNGGTAVYPAPSKFTASQRAWWRMGEDSTAPILNDEVGSNDGLMINMDNTNFVPDVP